MEKYYLSFDYGFGFIIENFDGGKYGTFYNNGILPEFEPIQPIDYVKKQYPYAKKNPLLIVESGDYLYEFLTRKPIKKVDFRFRNYDAKPRNYYPVAYADDAMNKSRIIDMCQKRVLLYDEINLVDEFCVVDLHEITVTEFSKLLKQMNCSKTELESIVTKIEANFQNASIWGKHATQEIAIKNKQKLNDENVAKEYTERMSANRENLNSVPKTRSISTSNTNENDPLGEYIANQTKQKRK